MLNNNNVNKLGVKKNVLATAIREHSHEKLISRLLLAGAFSFVANGSVAAATEEETTAENKANQLEVVTITSERRVQNLQDIPISATVMSANKLKEGGIDNLIDAGQYSPSVSIDTNSRSTFINIRGVGVAVTAPTSTPGVAYYIDGQILPHEQFIAHSFFDIQRMEILRGPQGTLTGQNSTGGAIYVTTPNPEFDEWFGSVDQTFGDYGRMRSVATLNAGFSDSVSLRVAAVHDERDSYTDNISANDSNQGDSSLDAIRANLAWRNSDESLTLNIRGEYFDLETGHLAVKNRNDLVSDDPFVIQEDADSFLNQRGYRLGAELKWEFTDGLQTRLLVATQDGQTVDQADGDRTDTALPIPEGLPAFGPNAGIYPGRVAYAKTNFETDIVELNLMSVDGGAFNWVVGAFIMNDKVPLYIARDNYHTSDLIQENFIIDVEAQNLSKSLFGQVNWFVSEEMEIVAGARVSKDSQKFIRTIIPGPPAPGFSTEKKDSNVTGKLALNYHLDDGMYYLSASKGYKAGGANLVGSQADFDAETNVVYEAGYKTEILDNSLRLNSSVFYSNYSGIQLSSISGGLPLTQNVDDSNSWGGELEALGQFGNLGFGFGIGYLKAEFDQDACVSDSNNVAPIGACTDGNRQVTKGTSLPFSPEWTMNASIRYDIELDNGLLLTPNAQWSRVDDSYISAFPGELTEVPSYSKFDVGVTLDKADSWSVQLLVKNVFDKEYIATQMPSGALTDGGYLYGAPRTIALRGVYHFGN